MTEYWVSTAKHFCVVCGSWMSGNINNIRNHEKSEKHLLNEKKRLRQIKDREKDRQLQEKITKSEIKRIEKEAAEAAEKDSIYFQQFDNIKKKFQKAKTSELPKHPPPPLDSACSNTNPWQYHYDVTTGLPYWFNSVTNESMWAVNTRDVITQQTNATTSTTNIINNIDVHQMVGDAKIIKEETGSVVATCDDAMTVDGSLKSEAAVECSQKYEAPMIGRWVDVLPGESMFDKSNKNTKMVDDNRNDDSTMDSEVKGDTSMMELRIRNERQNIINREDLGVIEKATFIKKSDIEGTSTGEFLKRRMNPKFDMKKRMKTSRDA